MQVKQKSGLTAVQLKQDPPVHGFCTLKCIHYRKYYTLYILPDIKDYGTNSEILYITENTMLDTLPDIKGYENIQ